MQQLHLPGHCPVSVAGTLAVIGGGCTATVLGEASAVRDAGLAVAVTGLAVLGVLLTRLIRLDLADYRVQWMASVAQEAIRRIGTEPDLDDEWRRMSG